MPFVTVGRENSGAIRIHYEDHGSGDPVVLIHGYPLSGHSWEKQAIALLAAGRRVITYDRRGFGASSQPSVGYDYDALAADLNVLLNELDLRGVALAGFGMGTGEVTRYLAAYGSRRVSCAAMIAPVLPFLLKTSDNPHGIDRIVFEEIMAGITADRPAAMKTLLDRFYNIDVLGGSRVSDQAWQSSFYAAIVAAPVGRARLHPGLHGGLPRRPGQNRRSRPGRCKATRTASCPPRPPATGSPRCSGTAATSG